MTLATWKVPSYSPAPPRLAGEDPAASRWECAFCKMVITATRPDFAPAPHYGGACLHNPDREHPYHWWHPVED